MVTRPDEWKWSSCRGYYGQKLYPQGFLECYLLLNMFSPDTKVAQDLFKEFNERKNDDQCLKEIENNSRLTDEEARQKI
ncbi:transposase, partial [Paenibacillus phytohabitans]